MKPQHPIGVCPGGWDSMSKEWQEKRMYGTEDERVWATYMARVLSLMKLNTTLELALTAAEGLNVSPSLPLMLKECIGLINAELRKDDDA